MSAAVAGPVLPALPDGVWRVDPQAGEIGFAVKAMWGLQTVRGVFRAYAGRLTVRDGDAAGRLTIEAGSLDTGHPKRDRHLRSADFFDAERRPQIEFTATDVAVRDARLTVAGELAIGAARLPLEIPLQVAQADDGALQLEGETTVRRKAAGITWNFLGTVGGEARLHARLSLRRAQTGHRAPPR
jgi:polyisoprenoid-binding protein YceI